jgi:DNA-binding transcriptional ArsR family regulator
MGYKSKEAIALNRLAINIIMEEAQNPLINYKEIVENQITKLQKDYEFIYLNCYDNVFKNSNRKRIYELVRKKEMNIKEITKEIGIAYNNVLNHINYLENIGMVKTKIDFKKKGINFYKQRLVRGLKNESNRL